MFTPDGTQVVGFMLKMPDIAGMIKQPDRFVAYDAIAVSYTHLDVYKRQGLVEGPDVRVPGSVRTNMPWRPDTTALT